MLKEIHKFEQPSFNPAEHSKSEFQKIMTSDGLFNMPAVITYPLNFDPSKKYPVIFTIYGGPDSKNISNRWQGASASWYSQNGMITFSVDHRGSGQFGKKGLDYLYRSLGKWELLDYADAVKWLLIQIVRGCYEDGYHRQLLWRIYDLPGPYKRLQITGLTHLQDHL